MRYGRDNANAHAPPLVAAGPLAQPTPMRRLATWLALLWAAGFAFFHVLWALGFSAGFPGGPGSHRLMMSSVWRYGYDWVVVLICLLAAYCAGLAAWSPPTLPRRIAVVTLAVGSIALLARGGAGLVFDMEQDLLWGSVFFVGGVLFAILAFTPRPQMPS